MTFFKVSFSADSLEGLTSLSGLNTSPTYPSTQGMEASDNRAVKHGLMGPPPVPGEYGLSNGGSNRNGSIPPAPPMQSTGISDNLASNSDQGAPPPLPVSVSTTGDGRSFSDTPLPPVPDSLIPNTGGDQAGTEVNPPQGPPKRQTKRSKKATKT